MPVCRKLSLFALLALWWLAVPSAHADLDWPQFGGPQRDGTVPATGLLASWPEAGPAEVWRVPIGGGFSGIAVAGDRLLTGFAEAGQEFLGAFDPATGKLLWRAPIGAEFQTEFGNGPRSTPAVDGELVFVLSSYGQLHAVRLADGSPVWSLDLPQTFGSTRPTWGFATSPLVDGDLLLIEAGGGAGKGIAALDKATGKVRWTALDNEAGYSSPLVMTLGGVRQYVFLATKADHLMALGTDGAVLWSHTWHTGTIAMPVVVGEDRIFVSAPNDVGAMLVQLQPKQGGGIEVRELWRNREIKNHFSASVAHGEYVYGFDGGSLKCISAASGETVWAKRGLGKGSLIRAGEQLVLLGDRGQVALALASPQGYQELGSKQVFSDKTWTTPALADGKLYLRNHHEMVCLNLKA